MKNKIDMINIISSDLVYLKEEYGRAHLYASIDGYVDFAVLIQWIGDNSHTVEHMIKVLKAMDEI